MLSALCFNSLSTCLLHQDGITLKIHVFFLLEYNVFQCCVGFCCTRKWISYLYTYSPSLSCSPPTPPPHLSRRALSWAICGMHQVPASRLFYTREVTARTWKQPTCPLTGERIKMMWCIYVMEYYLDTKRKETGSFVETWMDPESLIQNEGSLNEKSKYHRLTYACWI